MIELALLILVTLLVRITVTLTRKRSTNKSFPEPWGLPIIGQLLFIGDRPEQTFLKWKKKYGPVFQLNMLGKRFIILNDRASITECYSKQDFCGRYGIGLMEHICRKLDHAKRMAFSEGSHVVELRQFLLKGLKERNLQKNKPELEELVQAEIDYFLESWRQKQGEFFLLSDAFAQFSLNCIWPAVASGRLDQHEAQTRFELLKKTVDVGTPLQKLSFFAPSVVNRCSNLVQEKTAAWYNLQQMQLKYINEHEQTRTPGQPRDMIDQFLDKVHSTKNEASVFHPTSQGLLGFLSDMSAATSDTMTAFLEFVSIFSIYFTAEWKKLVAEIDRELGNRRVTVADKPRLPYTMACIIEVFRFSGFMTFGLPHSAIVDSEFRGVRVKKGTVILGNLYAVHFDPEVWDQPEAFLPQRFLTRDGTLESEAWSRILPFSAGKRACPGSALVEDMLFLIVTSMFQNFEIRSRTPITSVEGTPGVASRPHEGIEIAVFSRNA